MSSLHVLHTFQIGDRIIQMHNLTVQMVYSGLIIGQPDDNPDWLSWMLPECDVGKPYLVPPTLIKYTDPRYGMKGEKRKRFPRIALIAYLRSTPLVEGKDYSELRVTVLTEELPVNPFDFFAQAVQCLDWNAHAESVDYDP